LSVCLSVCLLEVFQEIGQSYHRESFRMYEQWLWDDALKTLAKLDPRQNVKK